MEFTYGFEVEGAFTRKLYELLKQRASESNVNVDNSIEYVDDSVVDRCKERTSDALVREGEYITELKLGVFSDKSDMLSFLREFKNNANYFQNQGCGVHVHVGEKQDESEFKSRVGDFQLMEKLFNFAKDELCPHVQERVTRDITHSSRRSAFCRPATSTEQLYYDWHGSTKYSFARNHDQYPTVEFRIFAGCSHKETNVRDFLAFFEGELKKVKPSKTDKIIISDDEEMPIAVDHKVKVMPFDSREMMATEMVGAQTYNHYDVQRRRTMEAQMLEAQRALTRQEMEQRILATEPSNRRYRRMRIQPPQSGIDTSSITREWNVDSTE